MDKKLLEKASVNFYVAVYFFIVYKKKNKKKIPSIEDLIGVWWLF